MLEYDPITSLRHWPTPMGKYGKTPFGDNLYRIVFRDSRRHLVGGTWPDGSTGYHWQPMYRGTQAAWILERWRPEPLTKRQWDRDLVDPVSGWLLLGPYPARGDYELCWEFDHGVDADNIDTIVAFVEHKRNWDWNVAPDRCRDEYEADQKETSVNNYLEMRDAMTAFGGAPLSSGRFGRGTKTAPNLITARDAGMPVPRRLPAGHGVRVGPMELSSSIMAGA